MNKIVSLFCGIVFGIGLVISEMINPEKVLGFLNLFDQWDPSLAFVMVGALIVSTPLYHLFKNKDKPLFNSNFSISTNKEIDKKLIIGSVFFGAGWGCCIRRWSAGRWIWSDRFLLGTKPATFRPLTRFQFPAISLMATTWTIFAPPF